MSAPRFHFRSRRRRARVAARPRARALAALVLFLSAVGSGYLVSFTSRSTQDIAPIPMRRSSTSTGGTRWTQGRMRTTRR